MTLQDACKIRDWVEGRLPAFRPHPSRSGLLIVDVQHLDAPPNSGLGLRAKDEDGRRQLGEYFDRLASVVLPNICLLLGTFRGTQAEVIFVRIASLTPDGRENNWRYREMGFLAPVGSREAEILEDIAPLPRELILTKSTSGAFASTNLDRILSRFGVEFLFVCGVVTHGCVETTVREAADRGYKVLLVEDACADYAQELHNASLTVLDGNFANVVTAAEVASTMHRPEKEVPEGPSGS